MKVAQNVFLAVVQNGLLRSWTRISAKSKWLWPVGVEVVMVVIVGVILFEAMNFDLAYLACVSLGGKEHSERSGLVHVRYFQQCTYIHIVY